MFKMIDIENAVIVALFLLVFAEIYGGMLIHVLGDSPAIVACFAVCGEKTTVEQFLVYSNNQFDWYRRRRDFVFCCLFAFGFLFFS